MNIERLIRDRHSSLVDKKLNKGLSSAELGEYQKLNRLIDAIEADFYEPVKKELGRMLDELHDKIGDELHGQWIDNEADKSRKVTPKEILQMIIVRGYAVDLDKPALSQIKEFIKYLIKIDKCKNWHGGVPKDALITQYEHQIDRMQSDLQFLAKIPEFHPVNNPPFMIGGPIADIYLLANFGDGYNIYKGCVYKDNNTDIEVYKYFAINAFKSPHDGPVCLYRLGDSDIELSDRVVGEVYYKLMPKAV